MAYFASLNRIEFQYEHPNYPDGSLHLDQRLERCFTELCVSKPVCCIFLTDDALLEINRSALQHDYYTDIITFDYSDDPDFTHNELYISLDRVLDNARELKQEFMHELHRVIIHGMLHLAGYNDKSPAEVVKMRALEDRFLDLQRST